MTRYSLLMLSLLVTAVVVAGFYVYTRRFAPTPDTSSTPPTTVPPPVSAAAWEVVATDLDTPWSIVFLPSGEMLVSERRGALRLLGQAPRTLEIPGVIEAGESGLTGLALHPDFAANQLLYVYFTTKTEEGETVNRVVRYRFDGSTLADPFIVVDDIPAGANHNGGQLAFGPDGYLYICTGDAGASSLAQDVASLGGKILRVHDDGRIPADNPFESAVYSLGHRNPQGIVWDASGRLFATEHGRSGLASGYDEVNLIESGKNYGWPIIQGPETRSGLQAPIAQSGSATTWAPAGIAYKDSSLYVAGLRGQAIYEVQLTPSGEAQSIRVHAKEQYGRLRAMTLGPDGAIYVSTSNRDGRGSARAGDDKVLRWMP